MAVEQVVPQHKSGGSTVQKIGADQERLSQAVRARLHGVGDAHPPAGAIPQQALEGGLIVGRGDDQHLVDSRQHQRAERVVDHRFVVHRQQLFADGLRDRMESCAAASGKDDPFTV